MSEQQLQGLADHLNQSRAEFVTAYENGQGRLEGVE